MAPSAAAYPFSIASSVQSITGGVDTKAFILLRLNSSETVSSYEKKVTVPFHITENGIHIESIMSKRLSFDVILSGVFHYTETASII